MRIGHIELSFGVEPRENAWLFGSSFPYGFNVNRQYREALLQLGRRSWLLTW
ncbi:MULTISPECIES: hypothetical protein [unclassified Mesorhizobium]|uniref:hypothetical protein n=1 Tax=unclassified Mesorhizobium TaxID=325217 RepID=UPI00167B8AA1|nr:MULTISPECIES: hypothetical protein [unclassified Mesorhizobium]